MLTAERAEFASKLADQKTEARTREKKFRNENRRVTEDRASDENAFKGFI